MSGAEAFAPVFSSMTFLDSLEHKLGRFAIPGLIRIVVAFNALVFVLYKLNPAFLEKLDLDRARIAAGEVWRLFTFVLIPRFNQPIFDWVFIIFYLGFLWMIGEGLEQALGSFKLNVFYLIGLAGAILTGFFFGPGYSTAMLNTSLFFAFAWFYPDMMIYIFWVLPVKVKWLAWLFGAQLVLGLLTNGNDYRAAVLISLANYALFFGRDIARDARARRSTATRRQRYVRESLPEEAALHTCEVCRRTELSHPHLDFRVSKNGHEYCLEHLPSRQPV
jgi:hypothetical protein